MTPFAELSLLTQPTLRQGASSAVERLFGGEGFTVWRKAVKSCAVEECHEELVEIPEDEFLRFSPHSYLIIGAPYGTSSPFLFRRGALERLRIAQGFLQERLPNWRLKIFDAYRPMRVQQFLVDFEYQKRLQERGLTESEVSSEQKEEIYREIFQIFAKPQSDPSAITPHSTGGAIDLTLVDDLGMEVEMGSSIDERPPLCLPAHFESARSETEKKYHQHRLLLETVMTQAGFRRLPQEWWHFSYGDPAWAVLEALSTGKQTSAIYGRQEE